MSVMSYNDRLVAVTEDGSGRKIVLIEGVMFKGKRNIRRNIYHASLIVRRKANGAMFLYDLIDIKKETSTPLELTE